MSPSAVRAELTKIAGSMLKFVDHPEAEQFRSSEHIRASEQVDAVPERTVTSTSSAGPQR
ncbi:hypothetical protein A5638_14820 [Mycolicibacterium fortuitum]|nr:hypothetical protein A5638_14820 [Mycolicibacterium fortuitum]